MPKREAERELERAFLRRSETKRGTALFAGDRDTANANSAS